MVATGQRALMDSGYRVSAAYEADPRTGSFDAVNMSRIVAWFAAGRGDRRAAVAALRRGAADPISARRPGRFRNADQICTSAKVYGLLGDADEMLPLLRQCLTMPNGYHLPRLGEPAFRRFRDDPRVRALSAEFTAARARARQTSMRAAQ